MRTLVAEHTSEKIRGKLTRYFHEVSPNIFVGDVSKTVADQIWEDLEKEDGIQAAFVEPSDNEQGYSVRTIGYPSYSACDFDGILLFSRKPQIPSYLASHCLAKSSDKTVLAHCLDAASVCQVLCTEGLFQRPIEAVCRKMGIKSEDFVNLVCWCCAVHDIGKLCPDFAQKIANRSEYSGMLLDIFEKENLLQRHYDENTRHEVVGRKYLKGKLLEQFETNREFPHMKFALKLVEMHHQGKDVSPSPAEDNQVWEYARDIFFEKISEHFQYVPINVEGKYGSALFLLALAIVNFSDFFASNEGFFSETITNFEEIGKYLERTESAARSVLREAGVMYKELRPMRFSEIFTNIETPRLLQKKVEELFDVLSKEAKFCIIEAPCGEGKTETGLAAINAMSNGSHGLFNALPTNATSMAMYPRMVDYLKRIDSPYTVELYSSKERFFEKEVNLEQEEMQSWMHSSYYNLAYPYGVGTIDQLIRGVRKEKYGLIRLFCSLSKGVLLDEIHSYDSYMLEIVCSFLEFCRVFDTPVVLMSASLDKKTKKKLVKAVTGLDYEPAPDYPLITYGNEEKIVSVPVGNSSKPVERKFQCLPYLLELDSIADQVSSLSLKYGGCIGVVLNFVDDAKEVYEKLKEKLPKDTEVILYHSKFYEDDKNKKTEQILKKLGKDRSNRPLKCVVVSTQILEQSIDIDFDILCSQIAPIDALIQRVGRLWRHSDKGTIRESTEIETPFYVYTASDFDFSKHRDYVYQGTVLEETQKVLSTRNRIEIPTDIRVLVDQVYENTQAPDLSNFAKAGNVKWNVLLQNDGWIKEPEVRYQSYETCNLSIVTQEEFEQLKEKGFPFRLCESILRYSTVSSVPMYKIFRNGLERIPTTLGKGLLKESRIFTLPEGKKSENFFVSLPGASISYSKEHGFSIF